VTGSKDATIRIWKAETRRFGQNCICSLSVFLSFFLFLMYLVLKELPQWELTLMSEFNEEIRVSKSPFQFEFWWAKK
jgi:hypothetical protein